MTMFFCKNHKINVLKLISLNHVQLLSRGKSENLEVLIKKKKKPPAPDHIQLLPEGNFESGGF